MERKSTGSFFSAMIMKDCLSYNQIPKNYRTGCHSEKRSDMEIS